MAKYRPLYTKIWKDPDFLEYTPEQKLLFIYFCTNDSTTDSGIYSISFKTISLETGLQKDNVENALLKNEMKNILYDNSNKYIFIKNFHIYNKGGNPALLKKAIANDYKTSKKTFLWKAFIELYPEFSLDIQTVDQPLTDSQPLTNSQPLTDSQPLVNNQLDSNKPLTDSQPLTDCQPYATKGSGSSSGKVNPNPKDNLSSSVHDGSNEDVIFAIYQNSFGLISSPYIVEELKIISQDYPPGWFEDAVKEAFLSATRGKPNLKYIESILERWLREGKDNGKKPVSNLKDTGTYKVTNQYEDARDYGKSTNSPA